MLTKGNGAILTERALEARLRSAKTVMQLEGKSADDIDDALPKLRDAESKALQAAESRWLRLFTSMSSSTPEQRREQFDQVRTSVGSDPSTLNIAHALEEEAVQLTLNGDMEYLLKIVKQQLFAIHAIPEFTR